MTMIDRSSFDAATLAALDDAARMLHMHRAVRGMNPTFKNASERGLSASKAKPHAEILLQATRSAATDLMEAAFSRDLDFDTARSRNLPQLMQALDSARILADQEERALPEIANRGVFRHHVELPLEAITKAWAAAAK